MGFWQKLRDTISGPKGINDPLFGRLTRAGKGPEWYGEIHFAPDQPAVSICIMAGEEGPVDEHRLRLKELRDSLPRLKSQIESRVFDELREWLDVYRDAFHEDPARGEIHPLERPGDVWNHLKLGLVAISPADQSEEDIQLSYEIYYNAAERQEGISDPEHVMHVSLTNGEISFTGIEG